MNRIGKSRWALIAALFTAAVSVEAAAAKQYSIKMEIFKISSNAEAFWHNDLNKVAVSTPSTSKIEETLDARVGLVMEDVELHVVVEFLSDHYGLKFVVDEEGLEKTGIDENPRIPYINLKNFPVRKALDAILKPLGLGYSATSNYILITSESKARTIGKPPKPLPAASVFTGNGSIHLPGAVLRLRGKEFAWRGAERPPSDAVVVLAKPSMVTVGGREASVTIHDDTAIQYLEHVGESEEIPVYALKELDEPIGLTARVTISDGPEHDNVVADVAMRLAAVTGRHELEGVSFDAGRPIVQTNEWELAFTFQQREWSAVLYPLSEDESILMLVIVAELAPDNPVGTENVEPQLVEPQRRR